MKSLEKRVIGNVHYGRKEFKKLAEENGDAEIDQELHGMVLTWVLNKLKRSSYNK